jgi:cobalamin-dependent methionine synthase I
MLIVGERINTSRKEVNEAVERRDAAFIQADVKAQVDAGARIVDVNAGSRRTSETADMMWLIDVIQHAVRVRLSLDSANPECLKAVIGRVKGIPMVNSTSAEKARFEQMAPVIEERQCEVVALCMDERGIPKTVDQVLENAEKLMGALGRLGVKPECVYLDPLIQAVSTDHRAGLVALEAIRRIRDIFPEAKTVCGLSNISFSLPSRRLINRTFLVLARAAGLSAALVDPLDKKLTSILSTTMLLLGQDPYCRDYLKAYRSGGLGD